MSDAPSRDPQALQSLRDSRVGVWTTALDAVVPAQASEYAAELEALGFGSCGSARLTAGRRSPTQACCSARASVWSSGRGSPTSTAAMP